MKGLPLGRARSEVSFAVRFQMVSSCAVGMYLFTLWDTWEE